MKRGAALLLVTLLLLAAQGVLLRHPRLRTDIATLVVVYLALERAVLSGATLALLVGYLNDLFAGTPRGLYTLSLVILFFVVRLLVSRLSGGRFPFVTTIAVASTAAALFLAVGIERTIGPGETSWASIAPELFPMLLSAGVLGYPCYRVLKSIDERLGEPDDADLVFRS